MGMYDFRDVSAASKDEQLRAWAVEQALEKHSHANPRDEHLIRTAAEIEDFVKNGTKENTDG